MMVPAMMMLMMLIMTIMIVMMILMIISRENVVMVTFQNISITSVIVKASVVRPG